MRSFFWGLSIITPIAYLFMFIFQWWLPEFFASYFYWLPLYFLALGIITGLLLGLSAPGTQEFVIYYLGATVGRLLLSIVVVGIVIFQDPEHRISFIAYFFAGYLFYLGFEIYSLITNLRSHLKQP